jgi:tonB-dependent receptor
MNKMITLLLLVVLNTTATLAQGSVKGKVLDKKTDSGIEFINIVIRKEGSDKILKGAITDTEGHFVIQDVPNGNYTLTASSIGYKDVVRKFSLTATAPNKSFMALYMSEDAQSLGEVVVTAQRSDMKLEVDRKTFSVDQQIANAGGAASDVLENIPSVEVDNDGNVSLRGNSSVEIWINGKSSGLTSDNRASILQQLPAESIERIEVIDNPSSKFSAEGSAGIINIVLKKNLKAGYYGSVQAGGDTRGGANTSVSINYNSSLIDAYANVGYRHNKKEGGVWSEQNNFNTNTYQRYKSLSEGQGNNLFTRAGITLHATKKDDISLSGMFTLGKHNDGSLTPYEYGPIGSPINSSLMYRNSNSSNDSHMMHLEFDYRHSFSDKHYLDFSVGYDKWKADNENIYQDSTTYFDAAGYPKAMPGTSGNYQRRPMYVNNNSWEIKLDYENQISKALRLQAGYQANLSKENTPQESFVDRNSWAGYNPVEDQLYYNRFIYKNNIHALYTTLSYNMGKFGLMAGLRGEYWKVNTESYSWAQEHNPSLRSTPFEKDFFQLFPSIFMSYQLTQNDQLQLNYTRRLRRPWGGQLNSFRNTSDATVISFGNPELTPEYSNSFSLNYLRTWPEHSLLVSAYYRPTTDVMQRITYRNSTDGLLYQTNFNVAKSTATGLELTAKNKLFRILNLSTSANFYYYKLDGFNFDIDGQTIIGKGNSSFTWNARMQASLMLPYDMSVQLTGNYNSRQTLAQGYKEPSGSIDFGFRKSFFNKMLVLSVNCRDLLDTRRRKTYTSSESFTRNQESWRSGRNFRFTLTWNFGNSKKNKKKDNNMEMDEDFGSQPYGNGGGE